jgi:flavin-dependent dehydrogenase
MEEEVIDQYFGNSMHVFLLNLPHIKFGALIPKGNYVTMVLLGDKIDSQIVDIFLESKPVQKCFPENVSAKDIMHCQCFPAINIQGAKSAYGDRMILIGDSASSKLYKNGIGAAFLTSKAAAKTAIFHGIAEEDFRKHYQKVCNRLDFDNAIGKFIFNITTVVQKSGLLKKGLYKTILKEQSRVRMNRRLSAILWDTFTGSAPYADILQRGLDPRLSTSFIWNMLNGKIKNNHNHV